MPDHITPMLERANEFASRLPVDAEAANDLFPPPYLSDDQGVTAMRDVYGAVPPRLRRGIVSVTLRDLAGLVLYALALVGMSAMVFGAMDWALRMGGAQ